MRGMIETNCLNSHARVVRLDCSPHEVAAAFHGEDYFAFLDSSRIDSDQGRYSILAWQPEIVFRSKGTVVGIRRSGRWQRNIQDPIRALERLLNSFESHPVSVNFAAGAIGYFGYDLFRYLEPYENLRAADDLRLPDCCLAVYNALLVFDHQAGNWMLTGAPRARSGELREAIERRIAASRRVYGVDSPCPPPHGRTSTLYESNMTRQQYLDAVNKALEYIAQGDIYQVNLSQRFRCSIQQSPFELFSNLRGLSPSFYGAYLNCGDHAVISSSPELFLSRDGVVIETRPIKGTRPRGGTPEEDETLRQDLLDSEKETAELAMIVDLERNDLGRICEYGSVEVLDNRYVDALPSLFHTVSRVRGRLREGAGIMDILRATFPGGSISGCPKIRAVQIIDELEPTQRHVYTGSIGFIGFNEQLRLNIAIRTMTVIGSDVYYQAGSGIVSDSVAELEYEETLQKAAALQNAIARTEGK